MRHELHTLRKRNNYSGNAVVKRQYCFKTANVLNVVDVDRDIDRVIDDFDYFDRMFRELDKLNDLNDLKENSVRNNITKFYNYPNRLTPTNSFKKKFTIGKLPLKRPNIQYKFFFLSTF